MNPEIPNRATAEEILKNWVNSWRAYERDELEKRILKSLCISYFMKEDKK